MERKLSDVFPVSLFSLHLFMPAAADAIVEPAPTETAAVTSSLWELFTNNGPWPYIILGVGVLALAGIIFMILRLFGKKAKAEKLDGSRTIEKESHDHELMGYIMPPELLEKKIGSIEGFSANLRGVKKDLTTWSNLLIGRTESEQNHPDICLDSDLVSKKHCQIVYDTPNSCFVIHDMNSTNHTVLVRGSEHRYVPAASGLVLEDGDKILVPNESNVFVVHLK